MRAPAFSPVSRACGWSARPPAVRRAARPQHRKRPRDSLGSALLGCRPGACNSVPPTCMASEGHMAAALTGYLTGAVLASMNFTLTSAQFTFTFSRGPRPKSRCISRRLCRQLHIKSCKIARILAGTFLNLPDKAIRTLKVVASDKKFYNTASGASRAQFLNISAAEKNVTRP